MSFIKFGPGKKDQEHYWTLIIEEGWVQSAVWKINEAEEESEVVAISSPVRWENNENLIDTVDTSLSATIQNLSEEFPEPSKTVFGVPSSWVNDGQIISDHLEKIRRICSKLSLEPTGFVVLSEAIAFFIKNREESPLNAVVIGLAAQQLELSVFKLGKLSGSTKVARSVSLFDDVVEGLSRFVDGSVLPSRFLIYNGKEGEIDEAKEALTSAEWSTGLPRGLKFVHSPKVETVSVNDKVLAVSLAGSSEIGKVKSVVITGENEERVDDKIAVTDVVNNIGEPEEEISAKDLGFVSDEESLVEKPTSEEPSQARHGISSKLSTIKKSFSFPKFKVNTDKSWAKRTLLVGFLIFVLAIVGLGAAWWFLPKATVTIFVSPRTLQEKDVVAVDVDVAVSDFDAKLVAGRLEKVKVEGSKTKPTSGTKTIGDKAKGVIRLRNGTPTDVNFIAGTVLEGPNNLKFSLDESVSVSAAISPTTPGTASAPLTADNIGPEYNLAKDETLKVSNYPKSEIDAIADSDFSGGSSREVSSVSQSDVDELRASLTDELEDEAREKITNVLTVDEVYIEGTTLSAETDSNVSNKVGDEAGNIELSLELEVSVLIVRRSDLDSLASRLLENETPQGFLFRKEQVDKVFKLESQSGGTYKIAIDFEANLLPDLDIDEIKNKISGKYPEVASDYLQTVPGFKKAEIRINPRFPGKFGTLPKVKSNISIEISASK